MRAVAFSLTQLSKPSAHYIYTRQVTSSQATEQSTHQSYHASRVEKWWVRNPLHFKVAVVCPMYLSQNPHCLRGFNGSKVQVREETNERTNVKCRTLAGCGGRNAELEPLNHVTLSKVRVASHLARPPIVHPLLFSAIFPSLPF